MGCPIAIAQICCTLKSKCYTSLFCSTPKAKTQASYAISVATMLQLLLAYLNFFQYCEAILSTSGYCMSFPRHTEKTLAHWVWHYGLLLLQWNPQLNFRLYKASLVVKLKVGYNKSFAVRDALWQVESTSLSLHLSFALPQTTVPLINAGMHLPRLSSGSVASWREKI